MSEVYYVMTGEGSATVAGETAAIKTGDAVPVGLGEEKSFKNASNAPIEFMIIGIARDLEAKKAYMMSPVGNTGLVP
jgi:mannose-6-phosphate isomerase-like protein (cupin superfamily)